MHCTIQLWQQYVAVVNEEATAWLSLWLPQTVLGALSMYGPKHMLVKWDQHYCS